MMGKKEFGEKGATSGLMVRMIKTLWGTGKVVVTDNVFCVLEEMIAIIEKGVLGSALIKKRH